MQIFIQGTKMLFKKLSALCIVLIFPAALAYAQTSGGQPGAFLRAGVGVRALALGGAFTGLANDPSAGYWNPAGLAQLDQLQLLASTQKMSLDRRLNFVTAAAPFGYSGTVGLSWIGMNISGIEGRSGNTPDPDFIFSNADYAFLLSYAMRLFPALYVGGNAKMIYQQLHQQTGYGFGFDLGVLFKLNDYMRLGFAAQNIATSVKWSSGLKESFPNQLRGGVALNLEENLIFTADILKRSQQKAQFAVGAEYNALDRLPLRLGFSRQGFVGGAGMEFHLSNLNLDLNYAYGRDLVDGTVSHKISVGIAFFAHKKSHSKSRVPVQQDPDFWSSVNREVSREAENPPMPVTAPEPPRRFIQVTASVLNVRSGPGRRF
ncbi:MAG: hypothetical protein D6814_09540, partial [Calditrichaeota bacterium]